MNSLPFNNKVAAFTTVASTILSIALIINHPTIGNHELSRQVAENAHEMGINNLVHGGLIGLLMANCLAFAIYSSLRGLSNISVLSALTLYIISTILMTLAALVNGFIYPNFLQEVATHQSELLTYTPLFRAFSWNINQALANTSVIGTSLSIAFWSLNLLQSQQLQKIVAVFGLIIGLTISISIISGWLTLNLFGMTLVVCIQGIWNLAIAYLLLSKTN
ncbi:hypothetical protein EYS14_12005 [Alteromonadaceae bacterium M269]|nr:hypothetical protein EYS14_12005 [Alteromonadaceae bacterium M269]